MTHINQNLGLRPAGKRSMMKLPKDRALAAKVTAAKCPDCQRTGAHLSRSRRDPPNTVICGWCAHTWELPA